MLSASNDDDETCDTGGGVDELVEGAMVCDSGDGPGELSIEEVEGLDSTSMIDSCSVK